jgi:glyoxalase family protein
MVEGIHHVTAIASDGQRNIAFYRDILGLRLVKVTVNFDDPTTYHLYYGDKTGKPGSILTFFAWPQGQAGRQGAKSINAVAFRIPPDSVAFWIERLVQKGIKFSGPDTRFGQKVISMQDPDGLAIELIAVSGESDFDYWDGSTVAAESAIQGIYGVTLWFEDIKPTADLLINQLGYKAQATDGSYHRFISDTGKSVIDIRDVDGFWDGTIGIGSIHHLALSVIDGASQHKLGQELEKIGLMPTSQIDRKYFRSVYFREPGETLFEIATEQPGFMIDETEAELGTSLRLPEQYEEIRAQLEKVLPKLKLK